jgi:hypothetical protein
VEAERLKDSLLNDVIAKLDTSMVFTDETSTKSTSLSLGLRIRTVSTTISIERAGPLLPVEWYQRFPFNNEAPFCDEVNNVRSPAGCVAVTVAQLMAYYGYPNSIDGNTFDWRLLRNYTIDNTAYRSVGKNNYRISTITTPSQELLTFESQAARLLRCIGSNVGTFYGCDNSGASFVQGMSFLKDCGYTYYNSNTAPNVTYSYDFSSVKIYLDMGFPMVISGYAAPTWTLFGYVMPNSSGHMWILDGYLTRKTFTQMYLERVDAQNRVVSQALLLSLTLPVQYLHNNWGWGNNKNGYFVEGSFNASVLPDLDSNTKSGKGHDYVYTIALHPVYYHRLYNGF